jgi:hypothetical protein
MPNATRPDDKRKRKRRPKAGDTEALRRILWQAALELEKLLSEEQMDAKLKTANALATLGGVYLKAVEQADLEKRVKELEQAHEAAQKAPGRWAA